MARNLRRAFAIIAAVVLLAVVPVRPSAAQAVVPADVQAELLSKLAGYDRNFASRAGDVARVLLLIKPDSPRSQLSAEEMRSALSRIDRVGGLPHEETIVAYPGADALAARCRADHVSAIYITPGFSNEIEALRTSLTGVGVLSLAAVPDYVPQGIVLGFDLDSGKPKLLLNLVQARRQDVNFPADVLRLMKVYR